MGDDDEAAFLLADDVDDGQHHDVDFPEDSRNHGLQPEGLVPRSSPDSMAQIPTSLGPFVLKSL